MSRFFNKDMNIQYNAQTEAKAGSRHRLSQSPKDKPIHLNLMLLLLVMKLKWHFKRIKNKILIYKVIALLLYLNTHRL